MLTQAHTKNLLLEKTCSFWVGLAASRDRFARTGLRVWTEKQHSGKAESVCEGAGYPLSWIIPLWPAQCGVVFQGRLGFWARGGSGRRLQGSACSGGPQRWRSWGEHRSQTPLCVYLCPIPTARNVWDTTSVYQPVIVILTPNEAETYCCLALGPGLFHDCPEVLGVGCWRACCSWACDTTSDHHINLFQPPGIKFAGKKECYVNIWYQMYQCVVSCPSLILPCPYTRSSLFKKKKIKCVHEKMQCLAVWAVLIFHPSGCLCKCRPVFWTLLFTSDFHPHLITVEAARSSRGSAWIQ